MQLNNLNIGFAITGSFCTIADVLKELEALVLEGANVIPIISENVGGFDTRFTKAEELKKTLRGLTGNEIIENIQGSEQLGPSGICDVLVIAPCTGNTLAKISNSITDTSVTMAAKAQLRNEKPLIIAVSTNDGLGANAKNIGVLLNRKNVYMVPFYQDDPVKKARSLLSKFGMIKETIIKALDGEQIQPIIQSK
ncbi:MAG: dipicolinate synthase subunit B [Clostridiales bacterium]|nr:dipicolinate synthase subunit B [Clostridiales bacterium]